MVELEYLTKDSPLSVWSIAVIVKATNLGWFPVVEHTLYANIRAINDAIDFLIHNCQEEFRLIDNCKDRII